MGLVKEEIKVVPLLPHLCFPPVVAVSQGEQKALSVLSVVIWASLQQKTGQETERIQKGFPSQRYALQKQINDQNTHAFCSTYLAF